MGKAGAAVAIVAAALTLTGTASPWSRQPSFELQAAALTGLRPAIVCETAFEHSEGVKAGRIAYYGFTLRTRPALVALAPSICRALQARAVGSTDFAFATWVLAHELGHVVMRTKDETAAECYAMERWRALAALFGVASPTPEQAARVSTAHDRLPDRYQGAC
jgi:hypothetical protein